MNRKARVKSSLGESPSKLLAENCLKPEAVSRNLESYNQQQSELQLNFKDESSVTDADNLRTSVEPIALADTTNNF